MKIRDHPLICTLTLIILLVGTAACSDAPSPTSILTPSSNQTPTAVPEGTDPPGETPADPATPFVPVPTPTAVPLAMRVNGEPIEMAEFLAEIDRFMAANPGAGRLEAAERVTDELIAQALLAGAAAESGFVVDDILLADRLAILTKDIGGPQALVDWQAAHGYTPEMFRTALRRSIAAAWMRDQIIGDVPQEVEQVRARHLLLSSRQEAANVLAQLDGGTDFDVLLSIYDPISLGELGWFPRGYLFEPLIEEAAFALAPGDYSGVIETGLGFHIVQTTDRADSRPLDPDARLVLQTRALEQWLADRRQQSVIESFIP